MKFWNNIILHIFIDTIYTLSYSIVERSICALFVHNNITNCIIYLTYTKLYLTIRQLSSGPFTYTYIFILVSIQYIVEVPNFGMDGGGNWLIFNALYIIIDT